MRWLCLLFLLLPTPAGASPPGAPVGPPAAEPSPFTVVPQIEVPVMLALTLVSTAPRLFGGEALRSACGLDCDPETVNPFDRVAIGLEVTGANEASDVLFFTVMGLPYLFNFIDVAANRPPDRWYGYAADTLVLTETLAAAVAATNVFGFLVRRPRPYTYDADRGRGLRLHPIGQLSFFSGHSAVVVAMGVAGTRLLAARHPGSPLVILAGVGTAGAGIATAFLRPLAGQHFPTDVIVGSLAGLGLGLLIPALHERRAAPTTPAPRLPPPRLQVGLVPQPGGAALSVGLSGW